MIAVSSSIRAFCVGQAKSGTASLAGLLRRDFRTAHEPEREATLDLVMARDRGDFQDNDFAEALIRRDRRLRVRHRLGEPVHRRDLVKVFPTAKFVVLLGDPFSWLQSVIGHLISRDVPSDVMEFLDWWFRADRYPPGPGDTRLDEHGLHSITAYLMAWNRHIDTCMTAIPPERRLVLRTHELTRSHEALADFLEIPSASFDAGKGHQDRSTWSERLDALVESEYLEERVQSVSGEYLARYFPEVTELSDVSRLWASD